MPKSKLPLIAALLCGLGCQSPAPKRVYVDFEAVLASYKASPLPSKPLPKPPGGLPAKTVSVPAVPAKSIVVQGATTTRAREILEENRRLAVRELTRLLAQRYVREVERAGAERIKGLEPGRATAYQQATEAVWQEFLRYAEARGEKVARLTSIVGFPDPNPQSLPPRTPVPSFVQKDLDEAARLRREIQEMDLAYEQKIGEILAQVGKQYDVNLTEARVEIEKDRAAAMQRAESEAVQEASRTYRSLAPLLMGSQKMELAGQPAQSVTLPAIPAPAAPPQIRERALTLEERRRILKSQLDIWLALNHYELADNASGGDNVTTDFVAWRQERKL